jgi:hypothetical protein
MHGRAGLAFCLAVVALPGFGAARGQTGPAPQPLMEDPELARSDYLEQCAGCHGVNGSTAPAQLPELRGRVGWFMCTPDARAYLLRLPNVAQSRIKDNRELANMMNFVVFVLGEGSAPAGTKPFTEAEVARERQLALTTTALTVERARQASAVIRKCHAPASLRLLYPAQMR